MWEIAHPFVVLIVDPAACLGYYRNDQNRRGPLAELLDRYQSPPVTFRARMWT